MAPDTQVGCDWVKTQRPDGMVYAAYHVSGEGHGSTDYLTGLEAGHLIAESVRRKFPIAALLDGTLLVAQETGSRQPDRRRAVMLSPVVHPRAITPQQLRNLELIDRAPHAQLVHDSDGAIAIRHGSALLPPGASWILRRRGWTAETPSGSVSLSIAGRIAMAYHWAHTHRRTRQLTDLLLNAALDHSGSQHRP